MGITGLSSSVLQQAYSQLSNPYTGIILSDVTQPTVCVTCNECCTTFSGGLGGGLAESRDEAMVAAYANGWYVGKNLKICLACRKKITPSNVDEDLLQDS